LTRPSAHHRLWVDGWVKPGHDDKRMVMGVVIIETWYNPRQAGVRSWDCQWQTPS
jgi:hypothetical protein